MKKCIVTLFVAVFTFLSVTEPVMACTSAIFTGKSTPDGRPLMWKHRDTDEVNNIIRYFYGERYNFVALTDAWYSPETAKCWSGNNEAGFCIMNTASYNLKDDDIDEDLMVNNGKIIYRALEICATLQDFEKMLDTLSRPMYVESNYGVIDANGGAAYYEVNNHSWKKIDVNDPAVAPQGYLVYSNHSYTGRINDGSGYIRYTNAENTIKTHIGRAGEITPQWIFKSLSRCFYHSLLGIDLIKENSTQGKGFLQQGSGWFIDQDFIPRESSTSAIVFQGVKKGEDPMEIVMWTALGYPPVAVAVPVFIKAKENQPFFMTGRGEDNTAMICNLSLELKAKVFPIKRGNGYKYYNFSLLHNPQGTGYMQQLAPVEDAVFEMGQELIGHSYGKPYSKELYESYYNAVYDMIEKAYRRMAR